MDDRFFQKPVLNSPYAKPALMGAGCGGAAYPADYREAAARGIHNAVPAAKRRDGGDQATLALGGEQGLSTDSQKYAHTAIINGVRGLVDQWRLIPSPNDWRVTPERLDCCSTGGITSSRANGHSSARLRRWKPAIWLTEVAPNLGKQGEKYVEYLANANRMQTRS